MLMFPKSDLTVLITVSMATIYQIFTIYNEDSEQIEVYLYPPPYHASIGPSDTLILPNAARFSSKRR